VGGQGNRRTTIGFPSIAPESGFFSGLLCGGIAVPFSENTMARQYYCKRKEKDCFKVLAGMQIHRFLVIGWMAV
jgi:hypothetical protein